MVMLTGLIPFSDLMYMIALASLYYEACIINFDCCREFCTVEDEMALFVHGKKMNPNERKAPTPQ